MPLNSSQMKEPWSSIYEPQPSVSERTNWKDYAELVAAFAQNTMGTSPIAGELFEGLAAFLNREPHQTEFPKVDVFINTLSTSSGGVTHRLAISELGKLQDALSAAQKDSIAKTTVIFVRGHQPPECLTRIGATFQINPYFFLRHLEYFWSYKPLILFSFPCLPSSSRKIMRLKMVTLGEREEKGGWIGGPQVQDLRAKSDGGMENYLHDVSCEYKLNPGNSIVRNFNTHSNQYFSIEQEVTATIQETDAGWLTSGKWPQRAMATRTISPNPSKLSFHPTIQHFTDKRMKEILAIKSSPAGHTDGLFAQTALSLAHNYGLNLDHDLAGADSFYALTELFQTSASSVCQFLNLLETVIDTHTGYDQYTSQDFSLGNLAYHQNILKRLESRLGENISDLQGHHSPQWPRTYDLNDDSTKQIKAKAEASAQTLLTDFRNLLSRTQQLAAQCQSGMSVCMNSAAIAESQRAIEQAKQVERLTGLAFFYIPLSFTTSFLGMNLKVFGSGDLRLWIWFAFAVPLLLISYFVLAWLSGDLYRSLAWTHLKMILI